MNKKTIVIMDSATFRNKGNELVRVESTFGSFRNEHLAKYSDKLRWVVAASRNILSTMPHDFFYIQPEADDITLSNDNNVSLGIAVLTKIDQRIDAKLGVTPDLIIYSSGESKDWDDFDRLVNRLDAGAQRQIREKTILVNTTCCNYSIIIPRIVNLLRLSEPQDDDLPM